MIAKFWTKYWHFTLYITQRIWHYVVEVIVNIFLIITYGIWNHYYFSLSEVHISSIHVLGWCLREEQTICITTGRGSTHMVVILRFFVARGAS